MGSHTRGDLLGRVIGMLVFLAGVALLGLVFSIAYKLFALRPEAALQLSFSGNAKTDPTLPRIGSQFGWLLFRVGYLFVMAIAGSLISQKGINLYFSAMRGHVVEAASHAAAAPPAG